MLCQQPCSALTGWACRTQRILAHTDGDGQASGRQMGVRCICDSHRCSKAAENLRTGPCSNPCTAPVGVCTQALASWVHPTKACAEK